MRRLEPGTPPSVLTSTDCQLLVKRIFGLLSLPTAQLVIRSTATASTAFARGDAHEATATTAVVAELVLSGPTTGSVVVTNRLDDASLKALVAEGEAAAREQRSSEGGLEVRGARPYPTPAQLFFDTVPAAMALDARAAVFRSATDATEAAGLIGAGDLNFELTARAVANTAGLFLYTRGTYGEFSLTARTKDGTGSGWGWQGAEDWTRVTVSEVVARAVDLAARSAHPVAIEPGRYTAILEPAAVAELVGAIDWSGYMADHGGTPFSKDPLGSNKIGLQMLDSRLWMTADPWDPELPGEVFTDLGEPIPSKVVLFERGVLKNLAYDPDYAEQKGRPPVMIGNRLRIYAEGPTQTLDEMIASTQRGVWINRLSHVVAMNRRTLLLTGTTRDGAFLIENGKITKAIKNFRFTESPFFVLNKLEAAGQPIRASRYAVAPRLKVRDFDFTSLTEAV